LDPRGISQAFQVRRKRTGLPHIRLNDRRHGAATLAIEGDVNLELIRRRLGTRAKTPPETPGAALASGLLP
jgi:hypothetical protein